MSRALGSSGVMQEHADDGSNIALLQLSVPLPLSIDIAFATYVDSGVPSTADGARIMESTMLQSGARLTDMINMRRQVLSLDHPFASAVATEVQAQIHGLTVTRFIARLLFNSRPDRVPVSRRFTSDSRRHFGCRIANVTVTATARVSCAPPTVDTRMRQNKRGWPRSR